ncbi:MAG: phosphoribosylamine--glycine ligase [Oligosphaeraceae bacterium]|nr:phosphoribosylamine--glycine ligase [Oligosphaeraceae bacterium]
MNILLIGSGGREHALAWKLGQSPHTTRLYCAPGNPGMKNAVPVLAETPAELADFAALNHIDLTMVGPEALLCQGIVDVFTDRGLRIVGPDKHAAQLEGSKSFAKDFMRRHGLPTAAAETFTSEKQALAYLRRHGAPIVVKADGLAAGKGVIVASSSSEAEQAIRDCFAGSFGEAGSRVLLEDCLFGEEASILALCDGKSILPLASSQDHKRALDGDRGPNTGGMGAYSPAPVVDDELWRSLDQQILQPFLRGVQQDLLHFRGIIYAGIMVTDSGPKLLEFNVRFGDPETQAVLARLNSDLVEVLMATADARLSEITLSWSEQPAVCVVMTSQGYPGKYRHGFPISGIEAAEQTGAMVFQAGTRLQDGRLVTAGGRVLGVTALGQNMQTAVDNAYRGVEKISFEGATYRHDIAHRALDRQSRA